MFLRGLPIWAKTCLLFFLETASTACVYTQGVIASTACVMTQGRIASTAYGRPQAVFLQIFHEWKSVKIAHKGNIPLTPFTLKTKRILYWKR